MTAPTVQDGTDDELIEGMRARMRAWRACGMPSVSKPGRPGPPTTVHRGWAEQTTGPTWG